MTSTSIPIWIDKDGGREPPAYPIVNASLNPFERCVVDGTPSVPTLHQTSAHAAAPLAPIDPALTPPNAMQAPAKIEHVRGTPSNATAPLLDDDAVLYPTHHNAAAPSAPAPAHVAPTAATLTVPPHRSYAGRASFIEYWQKRIARAAWFQRLYAEIDCEHAASSKS